MPGRVPECFSFGGPRNCTCNCKLIGRVHWLSPWHRGARIRGNLPGENYHIVLPPPRSFVKRFAERIDLTLSQIPDLTWIVGIAVCLYSFHFQVELPLRVTPLDKTTSKEWHYPSSKQWVLTLRSNCSRSPCCFRLMQVNAGAKTSFPSTPYIPLHALDPDGNPSRIFCNLQSRRIHQKREKT